MKCVSWLLAMLAIAASAGAEPKPLTVQEARQEVGLTGYTRSRTRATLSAEVGGRAIEVNYEVGSVVGTAPFVRIDPTFADIAVARARRGIDRIDVAIARTQSRIDFLRKELSRIEALFSKDSTPEQRRDQARQELDQAVLEQNALKAEKAVEQTRLAELVEQRKRHDVYAPQGWIVTARQVEKGEIVDPASPLATVADFRRLVVPLSVTPEELAAIEERPSPFSVDLDGRPAAAQVRFVNPEFDEATRKLAIELEIDSWDGTHRGGLPMRLKVEVPASGLWIPKAAVTSRFDNPWVRLYDSGKRIQVIVLGETDSRLRIAGHPELMPGAALVPAERP